MVICVIILFSVDDRDQAYIFSDKYAATSTNRLVNPHSLSYHEATDRRLPILAVRCRSIRDECGSATMREEAHSSSSTSMTPFNGPLAEALRKASFTSCTVQSFSVTRLSSAMLPVRVGTR